MHTRLALVLLLSYGCGDNVRLQALAGRVAPGFPMSITKVTVMRGAATVADGRVAADGTFRLDVPPATGLTLRLIGAGASDVVFPRQLGSIERTFAIRGTGVEFDLGQVRFVGGSTTTTFVFDQAGTCDDDGHDANGATCIDDADYTHGSCDDGDHQDGEHDGTAGVGADQGDAVAEHNFPADGCADGGDNGGDDGGD